MLWGAAANSLKEVLSSLEEVNLGQTATGSAAAAAAATDLMVMEILRMKNAHFLYICHKLVSVDCLQFPSLNGLFVQCNMLKYS